MFFDVQERLNAALAPIGDAVRPSFREVEACLRAAAPVLSLAGCSDVEIAALAGEIIDTLQDGKVLDRADAAHAAAAQISSAFHALPAVQRALGRGPQRTELLFTGECAHCGHGEAWGGGRPVTITGRVGANLPLIQPVQERRAVIAPGAHPRKPYRLAQGSFSCDHHHPALDRAAVRRLLRSLGPDFGPEPPSGGSLARV